MPLNDDFAKSVAFVCADDATGKRVPVGTAFWIGIGDGLGGYWRYLVTAKHVVFKQKKTWVRLRREGGGTDDDLIPKWEHHPTADISVALHDKDLTGFIAQWTPEEQWADKLLQLGTVLCSDIVYYVGLLTAVPSMREGGIPMVRNGRVGALKVRDIPVRLPDGSLRHEPIAHLIDAHARPGFSGSPCMVEHPVIVSSAGGVDPKITSWVAVWGIVSGVFGGEIPVAMDGVETNLTVFENAGVTVVVPIELVRDVLDADNLKNQREMGNEKRKAKSL